MLFISLCTIRAGTYAERVERRTRWTPPEGMRLVAEYWLSTPAPNVILVVEADDPAQLLAATAEWDDVFDISVIPAVTADEGLRMAQALRDKELEKEIMAH